MTTDESIPDEKWWYSPYAEFEDFVGIGEERTRQLVEKLGRHGMSEFILNRLLKANGLPHGPCNTQE